MAYPETFASGVDTNFSTKLNNNFGVFTGSTIATSPLVVVSSIPTSIVTPNRIGFGVRSESDSPSGRIGIQVASSTESPFLLTYKSRGTLNSPTVINSGDYLLSVYGHGFDGTNYKGTGYFRIGATENWTTTANGTDIVFVTTPKTSATPAEALRITDSQQLQIKSGEPLGKITLSTSDASGGADGDLWLKY